LSIEDDTPLYRQHRISENKEKSI